MDISQIIAEIDTEIDKLQQARVLLVGSPALKPGPGRPKKSVAAKPASKGRKKRNLTPEARKRIADAQKRRWAEHRKRG